MHTCMHRYIACSCPSEDDHIGYYDSWINQSYVALQKMETLGKIPSPMESPPTGMLKC